MKDTVFSEIERLEGSFLDLLEEVSNIESPTHNKAGVDAVSAVFCRIAESHGFSVERLAVEGAGDAVCITMNPEARGGLISLSAHLDTVHEVGSFGSPAVRRDGERMWGPGVLDCKGGAVAAIYAMAALLNSGFRERPVRLLLQTDEELGSRPSGRQTIDYILEKSKGSVAFLNLEGHCPGTACIARKGIVTFTFTVKGKSAHASHCALEGANAIAEAAYKIIELEKLKDDGGLTCCCSVISGGDTVNTVPDTCVFKANVRFKTAEELAFVRTLVEQVANTSHIDGCSCTVTQPKGRVAMEYTERNARLLERLNAAFEKCALPRLAPATRTGGSDAADVTAYGTPCIDSLGTEGDGIHTKDEFIYLSSLKESARRIAAAVLYL